MQTEQALYEKKFIETCSLLKGLIVPHKTNLSKVRVGRRGDGGYVICKLDDDTYDALYSYGSDDNITFEKSFYEKYETPSYVYDHTIDGITDKPDYINFFKEGVASTTSEQLDTIDNHITKNGHVDSKKLIAQIDVEGAEWFLFNDNFKYLENFSQLIIEFHIFKDITLYEEVIKRTFKILNEKFTCVHIHGNNSLLSPWIDANFPRAFEVTYVRKDMITSSEIEPKPFPDPDLDASSDHTRGKIVLDYWLNEYK
jgi:hypothetical protein|tara:strand:+ start:9216 stop:9980 length:765 start_codon:yes stop_codon:yes gene_type:complete